MGYSRARLAALVFVISVGAAAAIGVPARVNAAENSKGSEQETTKTPAMSERVYKKLSEAQKLADKNDNAGAAKILADLEKEKLSPYEKAQLYNFFGYIYYTQENYKKSIQAYQTVLAQPELPKALHDQTLYTLAQLQFTVENYKRAIELINDWLKEQESPPPQPYILLASAYYQLKQYKAMIAPVEKAMDIAKQRNTEVKEQWWLLLRVAYYELNDYKKVTDILETLVTKWPKKEYWIQLAGMYGELNKEKAQLATYESAYDQGFLTRSSELVQLSQLLLQANVPYKAARIMQQGLDKGTIEKTAVNYRILSQAWTLAQEDKKAIPALKSAANLSPDGELYVRLAQSYLNLNDYPKCIDSAREALKRGKLRHQEDAYMALGMCLFETKKYEDARSAFRKAAQEKQTERAAQNWIKYIDAEEKRISELNKALQRVRNRTADTST